MPLFNKLDPLLGHYRRSGMAKSVVGQLPATPNITIWVLRMVPTGSALIEDFVASKARKYKFRKGEV